MAEKNYGKNWEIISWKYSFDKCQIYNGLKIPSSKNYLMPIAYLWLVAAVNIT